ncbi:MAG: DUF3810 domain-containing protein [Erysipelotrichaceae bacterium]|nr:DUF3810 domain-containing protein [Erysipelotrichaceae bacterium]
MKLFITGIVLFMIDGISMFMFHRFPDLFFPLYRNLSKKWIGLLSYISSPFPFAVWDILLIVLIIVLIVSLIIVIKKKKSILKYLSVLFFILSLMAFAAVMGWMLNHYAAPLSESINLDVKEYSVEQLYETCDYYLQKASSYTLSVERDENGHMKEIDFYKTAAKAGKIYEKLEDDYPIFKGSKVRVKKLSIVGEYLMYNGIIGMFMPLSGEAGVPGSVPLAPLPFTMAHEAAHRLGIASEQEANFCAFMACINSDDEYFKYSGYYEAFTYCFSSLYKVNPEKALELYNKYDEDIKTILVKIDRQDTAAIYRKYESPLKEVSDQINDSYLKTFSEESGIQSYGEVTDYLIAWYLKEKKD